MKFVNSVFRQSAFLLTSAFLALAPASKSEIINTVPLWDGSDDVSTWSSSGTYTYGQVITPSANGALRNYTVYINAVNPATTNYRAYVYQWDPTGGPGFFGPTGSALFQSGPLSISGLSGTFLQTNIDTGFVPVIAGQPYVLFLSTIGEPNAGGDDNTFGWLNGSAYAGGDFVFSNDGLSYTAPWDSFIVGRDLAFSATISPTPGPTPLLGIAAALGWSRKLRRRIVK